MGRRQAVGERRLGWASSWRALGRMSVAGQCLVSCLVGCLLIQIALRWGHPAICSVLPSEPWVNCHSSALSPPGSPTAAPQTVAAMAMSTAALPDDVWRGDVPGDTSNSSAGPLASWRSGSRHFVQEPFSWRRNRKKITELTSITTEKTREESLARARAAAPSTTESAPAAAPVGVPPIAGGGGTGLHWDAGGAWLADQWRPTEAAAGAQAPQPASAAAAGGAPSGERLLRRRRRRRRSSKALCLELQRLHDVRPGLSWGSLPGGQREAWSTMKCDSLLHTSGGDGGGGGGVAGLAPASTGTADGRGPPTSDASRGTVAECKRVERMHRVVRGASWGSATMELRQWWTSADCDRLLSGLTAVPPVPGAPKRAEAPGGECQSMQLAHRVRVGVDWGTLPPGKQERWTELGCDRVVN